MEIADASYSCSVMLAASQRHILNSLCFNKSNSKEFIVSVRQIIGIFRRIKSSNSSNCPAILFIFDTSIKTDCGNGLFSKAVLTAYKSDAYTIAGIPAA